MNFTDNTVMLEGRFSIQLIDAETGKVIQEHKENNKIMYPLYNWVSNLNYKPTSWLKPEDFIIHCVALGTDGIDEFNNPKKIAVQRPQLFSEENFWNGNYLAHETAYVYQATFEAPTENTLHYAVKTDEGATYPHVSGIPSNYRGIPYNDPAQKEAGLSIKRSFENNTITHEIYLGKFAGNGLPNWGYVDYSEAAIYMTRAATSTGDKLGAILAMKTFPKMRKTDTCIIKIKWDLVYNPN